MSLSVSVSLDGQVDVVVAACVIFPTIGQRVEMRQLFFSPHKIQIRLYSSSRKKFLKLGIFTMMIFLMKERKNNNSQALEHAHFPPRHI